MTALPLRTDESAESSPSEVVIDHVRHLLASTAITPAYRQALTAALATPGNILSNAPDRRWADLVLTCCAAAGGEWERAVPAAAAVEILMVALDVLDDEEDNEDTPLRAELGAARALNISTGLLFLAQRGLPDVQGGAGATILLDAGLRACGGQHADLSEEPRRGLSLGAALAVTAGKSASLVSAVCRIGSLCAGAPEPLQELYGRFGWCLGMVEQLANDIVALRPGATGKTDIELGRPTLPLTYAAIRASALTDRSTGEKQLRAALATGEPSYLAWVVADVYRREALGLIPRLAVDDDGRRGLAALPPALV